jgi:hypothetical protein
VRVVPVFASLPGFPDEAKDLVLSHRDFRQAELMAALSKSAAIMAARFTVEILCLPWLNSI